jgi:hypothetical protein
VNDLIQRILVAVIPSVVLAVVTALLTVRLSIRQFHSQRWWEKKADKYSAVLERLSELQFIIAEDLSDWEVGRYGSSLDSERVKRLQAMSHEAQIDISKAAAMGSFIISEEASLVLEKLRKKLDAGDGGDPYEEMGQKYTALKDAIPKIRAEAKKDLRVE